MKVPLSWLREYIDITMPVDQLAERLTLAGLEVEAAERTGDWWDRAKIVVAAVREVRPHPNADRLVLADVDYGGQAPEQCVTGAPNLFPFKGAGPVSLKVAFAMEGAELYDGHQEGFVKTRLKAGKIRGVPSRAMVCSEKELGISEAHEGIVFLPDDAPVGVPLVDYLGDTTWELHLTPNLARCMCVIGVAREVAALTGSRVRYPSSASPAQPDGPPAADLARVVIDDPDLCARYIAAVIRDVTMGPSPAWMQNRLRKAGMRPISNIVDITNYVMLEWGQPLHAFDYDKLVARAGGTPTIIVRRARPGETMTTLDGVQRTFTPDTLLICDTAGPVAVAGVMGGLDTEIDDGTRSILLESANFDLISIRRTTQAHKLPSEASARFGRGIHPALTELAAQRAAELMRLLAGGMVAQGMVDAYPRPAEEVVVDLAMAEVERTLGIALQPDEVVRILESLEFRVEASPVTPGTLRVAVPPHRLDCQLAADLIEEVARIHGYDRIPSTQLGDCLPPQRANRALEIEEEMRDILVGCGLQEVVTYSLTTPDREAALTPQSDAADAAVYVTLANPITQERTVLRRRLLTTVLEVAAANLRFRDRLALFEIGKVFLPQPGRELPSEPLRLAIVLSGPRGERHWLPTEGPECDYFDLKGVLETLLARLHVASVAYEPAEHPTYQPGRTARLTIEGAPIGILGELHPAVRDAFWDSLMPLRRIAAAELDLDALLAQVPARWFIRPVSTYPAVLQDLAVVVDEEVSAAAVQALIAETGGFLLKEVRLFDLYRGDPVPAGRKSLAFALAFQSPDKTLSDDQVAKQVKRIVGRLAKELRAELRR